MPLDPRSIIPAAVARLRRTDGADTTDDDERARIAQLADQITTALAVALGLAVVSAIAVLLGTG